MARGMLNDELRVHEFHILDVDWSFSALPFVLFPSTGFSSITAPELTIETEEIREGTSNFVRQVLTKGTTNTITLTKGVTPFNSDFWRWTTACLKGTPHGQFTIVKFLVDLAKMVTYMGLPEVPAKRRNLLLFHATGISLEGLLKSIQNGNAFDKLKGVALLPAGAAVGAAEAISGMTGGMVDVGITSIPGKVYVLFDCLPTRYKVGSDFDASTSAVSIEEIDLSFSYFEEFSLAGG